MFRYLDLMTLIEAAGNYPMTNGWQIVIRAEWVDVSVGRPHGLDYALILQNEQGHRLLGFDNAHASDGGREDEPFDHEHRANAAGRTFVYRFTSASRLLTDFFERCEAYCSRERVEYVFFQEDVS
jgi:hypothetical protein